MTPVGTHTMAYAKLVGHEGRVGQYYDIIVKLCIMIIDTEAKILIS